MILSQLWRRRQKRAANLAGIYSMMSFTVTQRRREIGIRAALGANPQRILAGIFSRALGQHDACAPYTNLISSRHQTQPNLRPSHKSFVQGDLSNESARGRYHRVSIGDHMLASGIEDVKD